MTVKATKLGPGILTLTALSDDRTVTDFAGQSTKTEWVADYKTEETTEMLSGDEYLEPGKLTSKITGQMLQDYGAGSLLKFCNDHAGEIFEFEFVPARAGKLRVTGNLMVTPVNVGGDVGKTNRAPYELPCVGKVTMSEDYTPA